MNKLALASLMVAFLLFGCKEEPDIPEDDLTIGLERWEISQPTYDFDINPRHVFEF